ncbi:hypothetical protein GCM10011318_22770 [Phaeocystidibacter marisrubri]|nr:hypothetical protein GCM10011318_22770 [Phaeocystidibacter marisrubri]
MVDFTPRVPKMIIASVVENNGQGHRCENMSYANASLAERVVEFPPKDSEISEFYKSK